MVKLSPPEISFVQTSASLKLRLDARPLDASRPSTLETNLITQSSGSSLITSRSTSIITGISLSVVELPEQQLVCNVSCSQCLDLTFQELQLLEISYSALMTRILNASLNIDSLIIIPDKVSWGVTIDVEILDSSGGIIDKLSEGIRAALFDLRFAKTIVDQANGAFDFEVEDCESEVLKDVCLIPISVSIARIGGINVVDPCDVEAACADVVVSIFVNGIPSLIVVKDEICGMEKYGNDVEHDVLLEMAELALKVGKERLKAMDKFLENEKRKKEMLQDPIGFSR
jgi:exosome complex component RRP42